MADHRAVRHNRAGQRYPAHTVARIGKITQRQPAVNIQEHGFVAVVPGHTDKFWRAKRRVALLVFGHILAFFILVSRITEQGIGQCVDAVNQRSQGK